MMVLLLLAMTGSTLLAQAPNNYYSNAVNKTGNELKEALHGIVKGHHVVSYGGLLSAFADTDCKPNGKIWDIYSNYEFDLSTGLCGEYTKEGDCWNREHTWPQSWFAPSGSTNDTAYSDLFHVYPTDGYVNNRRQNYPYGEVSNPTYTSGNGSKLGPCAAAGYSGTVFEPIDEYKGDIARSYFYMSVRYCHGDDNWGTSGMTNKSEILPWAMAMLLQWNDDDPVSQKEIDRNNAIYAKQHNRNPFIDNSEYARMIWDPNWQGGDNIGNGDFVKVTRSDEITDGDYLIVCENNYVAFDGARSILDAVGNNISVTISNGKIESDEATNAAVFTITAVEGGYSIKSASGYYIGNDSNANALKTSTTDTYVNSISITDGDADIVCSSSYLRFNSDNNQNRFRYFRSSTYTGQKAIQLYKKVVAYSITLASVEHGSISASAEEAVEGATVTLTAVPETGYELDAWLVTDAANNTIEVVGNQFVMPASDVMVSASFTLVGVPYQQKYYLVTSTEQLVPGRTYLIVNVDYKKALGKTQNTNNRSAADVTIDNNAISTLGDVCELRLGGEAGAWTMFDATNNSGYLYAAGGTSNNYLRTQSTLTDAGKWTISISGNKATIKTIDSSVNRHTIMYNNSSNLFSCYASGQKDVCLFIRSEEYEHTENTMLACLNTFDKHTVHSGVVLVANNVLDNTLCNQPGNLVLEDGAQLQHSVDGIQATLKKSITAYSGDGGWYTIATPFISCTPTGTMVEGDFDLYAYDEDGDSDGKEWINYKSNNFTLANGMGYLYANAASKSIRMAGTLNVGSYSETVDLAYNNSDADLKGFNLLGNPTAHDITFAKSDNVSDGYYYIHNGDSWTYATGNSVPVGRGFLVKANAPNQTVTLNPQSKRSVSSEEGQYLCLTVGDEKAYVKLTEGVSMPLMDLRGRHSSLYLLSEHKPYVMLVRDGAESLDLCYEARQNGEQVLSVNFEGLDLDYLHLIDNLTGADVDLLHTPSYAFEAKKGDYPTRFRLVFAPSIGPLNEGSMDFAYVADGEIRFVETCHGVSLQMMDMTGRTVLTVGDVSGNVSTRGMAPGVYVLRLVADDHVRIQKIVVP
jgi:endonuclease I